LLRPVWDFAEIWFERRPTLVFHDPLAATTIFDDQICAFTQGQVVVELQDETLLGQTRWREDRHGRHAVALRVDARRFYEHYFGVFG
jgi:inosine-uridine nucleoside N-ribohydrolase